jgi:hypothetical protein
MRTTIDIPTPLFKRAKAAAAKEGATLRAVLVRALEAYLAKPGAAKPYTFDWQGENLGPVPDDRLWAVLKDQDRQWYKDFLEEEQTRKERKR